MPKLTKKMVDAAAPDPNGGELFLWDSEVKGFGVRVKPSGAKSFILKYRIGTTTKRHTISKVGSPYTVDEARDIAADKLRDLKKEGIDPAAAKRQARQQATTVADLAEAFLTDGRADKPNKKERSWKTDEGNIRCHILPLLGKASLKELDRADVAKFQRDVAAGKTSREMAARARGKSVVKGGKGIAARSPSKVSTACCATRRASPARRRCRRSPWQRCWRCGQQATEADHITPISQGGARLSWSNLRPMCKAHHSQRTARDTIARGG